MALRLPAIMRTTAARLSALYLHTFRALRRVARLLHDVAVGAHAGRSDMETINEEVQGLDRAYRRGGLPFLVRVIEQRSRQPGANLYLIADANGRILTGNVESLEPGVLEAEGWTGEPFSYQRYGEGITERRAPSVSELEAPPAATVTRHAAIALVSRLPNQMIVLVGRDLGEPERFRVVVRRALIVGARHDGARRTADLVFRRPPRPEAHRQRFGRRPAHHGRRPVRPAAGDRRRRRVRPPVGKPQRHADQDRRAERGPEAGLRQHRPRSEDAADPAAQPRRGGACRQPEAAGYREALEARSPNPTG